MARPLSTPRKLLIYVPLTLFAAIALVPFAYMLCSSIKPKSVFFSSPFLPTTQLFELDAATGDLTVGDATLLPRDGQARRYELEIVQRVGDAVVARRSVSVAWGATPEPADFAIPPDATVNTRLGRVGFPAAPVPESADDDDAFDAVSYAVSEGNQSGPLGVAWGLLTLDNFDRLFRGVPKDDDGDGAADRAVSTGVTRAIVNSFFYASVSSVLATLGAAMGGYGLAKFRFRGRDLIDNTVLAALVIPGALLIAPGYQLLYWFGLLDTFTGLILPGIAPAFGVFLFRQAMIGGVPNEMIEAARIDGCGEVRLFFTMALPMVRPMAGAFLLITYLGAWNNFIGPQIVLQTPEKYPLAVWISQLRGVYGIDYGLIMAGTLVAVVPVLALFLMLQKEFIAGLTAGAVKG